jgi:hypothetical protein
MKRVIKDFKTITPEVMALINDQYPYGYEDTQLVTFVNAKGEFVKALEVRTDEIVYLIKLDRKLDEHINDYMEDSDSDSESSEDISFDSGSVDVEIEDAAEEEEDDD